MRVNNYTGECHLAVSGEGEIPLRFGWREIGELHSTFGREWERELSRVVTEMDAPSLARILAICTDRDADWWLKKSPPFMPAVEAVQEALHAAFFGPGGLKQRPTMARRLMTLLRLRGASGASSAGEPATSGT